MNDPGLDEPIARGAEQVERKYEENDRAVLEPEEEYQSFLEPARWWYASTGFPLLAGTLGPMANTFSVCALVQYWRVEIPPGGTEGHGIDIKDPKWLTAINAISLAFAIAANLSLLLNMARRLSFPIAQPITILGFWIASILLIALIAVASHDFHAPGVEDQALTQAYYYAIFSAGLYQIISYLMCVTFWGAHRGHYSKEFKLTMSQRTLMLQTITFMTYLLVGAAIYSHIEGWTFLDAVYWADFTCLTVGIGDYAPATHLGRSLLFPYAIGGIVALGLVVGSIRSMVLERGKKKIHARMTEKTRESILKQISAKDEASGKPKIRGLNSKIVSSLALNPSDSRMSERERRRAEFDAMRAVQELAATKRKWISLSISGGVFMFLWLVGALVFYKAEKNQNFTYFEGLYFAYTSLMTIGYGDLSPMSNSGKPFFVFWSLLAVPSLTILISDMGDTVVKIIKDLTIYLGELTILPSDESSVRESLRYGLAKISGGRVGKQGVIKGDSDVKEKPPGLANLPNDDLQRSTKQSDLEAAQLVPDDWRTVEKKDEQEEMPREAKAPPAEGHEHRHLLISEIKKMYAHVNTTPPKQFTYDEWAYFLRLLGEDEHDHHYHRRAPIKVSKAHTTSGATRSDSSTTSASAAVAHPDQGDPSSHGPATERKSIKEWSWLGNRSPLMDEMDEAEWILKRLFAVLERELRKLKDDHHHHHQDQHDNHQPAHRPPSPNHELSVAADKEGRKHEADDSLPSDPSDREAEAR